MEAKADPHESDSVGFVKRVSLPVHISSRVFKETSYVFEGSPFLGFVSGLFKVGNELVEISVGFLGKSSKQLTIKLKDNAYLPIISALSLRLGTP